MRQHAAPAALVLIGLAAAVALATRAAAGGKAEAVQPFNGRDLTGWMLRGDQARSRWVVGRANLKAGYHAFSVLGTDGKGTIRPSNPVLVVVRKLAEKPSTTTKPGVTVYFRQPAAVPSTDARYKQVEGPAGPPSATRIARTVDGSGT